MIEKSLQLLPVVSPPCAWTGHQQVRNTDSAADMSFTLSLCDYITTQRWIHVLPVVHARLRRTRSAANDYSFIACLLLWVLLSDISLASLAPFLYLLTLSDLWPDKTCFMWLPPEFAFPSFLHQLQKTFHCCCRCRILFYSLRGLKKNLVNSRWNTPTRTKLFLEPLQASQRSDSWPRRALFSTVMFDAVGSD